MYILISLFLLWHYSIMFSFFECIHFNVCLFIYFMFVVLILYINTPFCFVLVCNVYRLHLDLLIVCLVVECLFLTFVTPDFMKSVLL